MSTYGPDGFKPPDDPGNGPHSGFGPGAGQPGGQSPWAQQPPPAQQPYPPAQQYPAAQPYPAAQQYPPALPGQAWGPAPGFGPPPDPGLVSRVHGQGVALLVLGIVAVLVSCCTGLYGSLAVLPAIAMTVLGGVVMSEARHSPQRSGGKIKAGWICGGVWLGVLVLTVLALFVIYGAFIGLPLISDEMGWLSSTSS